MGMLSGVSELEASRAVVERIHMYVGWVRSCAFVDLKMKTVLLAPVKVLVHSIWLCPSEG